MAVELGHRPAQGPEQPRRRFRDSYNEFMGERIPNWNHQDPRIRRRTRVVTYAVGGVLFAISGAVSAAVATTGLEAITPDPQVGNTPPVDPNPAYTGPADHCWTVYDHAVAQAATPDGSITPAEAQTLFDCTNENPGYFGQQTVPVSDGSSVVIGDRPLK